MKTFLIHRNGSLISDEVNGSIPLPPTTDPRSVTVIQNQAPVSFYIQNGQLYGTGTFHGRISNIFWSPQYSLDVADGRLFLLGAIQGGNVNLTTRAELVNSYLGSGDSSTGAPRVVTARMYAETSSDAEIPSGLDINYSRTIDKLELRADARTVVPLERRVVDFDEVYFIRLVPGQMGSPQLRLVFSKPLNLPNGPVTLLNQNELDGTGNLTSKFIALETVHTVEVTVDLKSIRETENQMEAEILVDISNQANSEIPLQLQVLFYDWIISNPGKGKVKEGAWEILTPSASGEQRFKVTLTRKKT